MPIPSAVEIPPQSGAAFALRTGAVLEIIAIAAEQVADLAIVDASDVRNTLSAGRTIDYNERIRLTKGDTLYSHRSTPLMTIVEDTVGIHDILLSPCSEVMFERRGEPRHASCHENLHRNLQRFGVAPDDITTTFNVFMNVRLDEGGRLRIDPPACREGDRLRVRALCDVYVGLTACSSELTNNGRCKAIGYVVA